MSYVQAIPGTGRRSVPVHRGVRDLLCAVTSAGGQVTRTKRHYQVCLDGRPVATVPTTPSDHRSLRNSRAALRRAGMTI